MTQNIPKIIPAALVAATMMTAPAMAGGPYPNETCGEFARSTSWAHVHEVADYVLSMPGADKLG